MTQEGEVVGVKPTHPPTQIPLCAEISRQQPHSEVMHHIKGRSCKTRMGALALTASGVASRGPAYSSSSINFRRGWKKSALQGDASWKSFLRLTRYLQTASGLRGHFRRLEEYLGREPHALTLLFPLALEHLPRVAVAGGAGWEGP